MSFDLYYANCIGNQYNCEYPNRAEIKDTASLIQAVSHDYVCADYKNHYRSKENFLSSNTLAIEFDNDHSDDPTQWITPEIVRRDFPEVSMAVHYSRNHMKEKNGHTPRPKFHLFMESDRYTSVDDYSDMKRLVAARYPFVDLNALDGARFFYGTPDPKVEYYPGTKTVNQALEEEEFDKDLPTGEIREGSRNSSMFHWAVRYMKRFGNSDESKEQFYHHAEKCNPPLDDAELNTIWRSACKYYGMIVRQPDYIPPQEYNNPESETYVDPIPFSRFAMAPFPVDALPKAIRDYVDAVAESTQTPADMAGATAISVLSVCLQGKYKIRGKDDWFEPLNTYSLVIAQPSERKSAVLSHMIKPMNDYEQQINSVNASRFEYSRMQKRILERKQKQIEDLVVKGKATQADMDQISKEIAAFKEEKPLQLYADDVTPEKLVSIMAENDGRAAIVSSEGGIFDTLAGIYTKTVNIDAMLKGYSGDVLRVDRIGRESERINHPALSILLMTQPKVVSEVLGNKTFRGKGLVARFLYSMPRSIIGERDLNSMPIPEEVYRRYERTIINLLKDEYTKIPEIITVSNEAYEVFKEFHDEIERKIKKEYADLSDWVGKLLGNTLRISGLLCRADVIRSHDFLDVPESLVVDKETMINAVRIGKYYLNQAQFVFDALPENKMYKEASRVLEMIAVRDLKELDRRTVMRNLRSFKKAADVQPVLDFLEDYGYIVPAKPKQQQFTGRPPLPKYRVNPKAKEMLRHVGRELSYGF